MQFLYYALFAAGIVAVDQLSKYFTIAYIPLYTDISFIPGRPESDLRAEFRRGLFLL